MQLEVRLEGTLEAKDQLLLMVQSTGGGAVTKAVTKGIEKKQDAFESDEKASKLIGGS